LERVKILFQIRSADYPYKGVWKTLTSIWENEGILGLWKGNNATIIRIFPYAAIQFMSYEKYKKVSPIE
jgi:solute carrier family 25 protein 16